MTYQIKFLSEAVKDREEIKKYLSQYYESTPTKFLKKLRYKVSRLKQFPYSCITYEYDQDYRVLVVADYLVFYMINEEEKSVEIHRIFHGSKDIRRYLSIDSGC